MPHTGNDLGIDLSEVWLCAHSYLPKVAEAFTNASKIVDRSAANSSAFNRYAPLPGGVMSGSVSGLTARAWASARDSLQDVMATTANNIYATCDALDRVIDIYASADTEAGIKFRAERDAYTANAKKLEPGDSDYIWIEDPHHRPRPQMSE